jgi:hypothetical protein
MRMGDHRHLESRKQSPSLDHEDRTMLIRMKMSSPLDAVRFLTCTPTVEASYRNSFFKNKSMGLLEGCGQSDIRELYDITMESRVISTYIKSSSCSSSIRIARLSAQTPEQPPRNIVNLQARITELPSASNTPSSLLTTHSKLQAPCLKFPLVCAASSEYTRSLLTLHPVLDGGTGFLKAGYAGQVSPHICDCMWSWKLTLILQNFPDHQYPSIVGRPILRTEEQNGGDIQLKDIMCGDEAAAARSMLQITYPVCGGSSPRNGSLLD